jgi:hypothetical protein
MHRRLNMVLSLNTGHLFVRQQEKIAIYSSAEYSGVRMSVPTFAERNSQRISE